MIGGVVNVPLGHLPTAWTRLPKPDVAWRIGNLIVIPEVRRPRVLLAANLGGAVIPVGLSLYLIVSTSLYLTALVAVSVVALLVHALARSFRASGLWFPCWLRR